MWPAPSICLICTALGFPLWNASASDSGKYLSDNPHASNIGFSQLYKCYRRDKRGNYKMPFEDENTGIIRDFELP